MVPRLAAEGGEAEFWRYGQLYCTRETGHYARSFGEAQALSGRQVRAIGAPGGGARGPLVFQRAKPPNGSKN